MLPKVETMQACDKWVLTIRVHELRVLKRYKEPSVPIS